MIWTEIPLDGNTDLYVFPRGGITTAIHRSDILEHIVKQHAGAIGDGFILMTDNARAHIAQVYMTFIDYTDIRMMTWPARSPDFNLTDMPGAFFLDVFDNGRIIQRMYRTLSML